MLFIIVTTAFIFCHYSKYSSHSICITRVNQNSSYNTVCIQEDYKITTYQFKSICGLNWRGMPLNSHIVKLTTSKLSLFLFEYQVALNLFL